MKHLTNNLRTLSVLLLMFVLTSNASAFDFKTALGGLFNQQSDSTETTGNGAGSALGSLLSGLFSSDKVTLDQVTGTWNYSSPAVSFKSENLLKKAGGEAAALAVEQKLAPYYKTTGLDKLVFTVNADSTFTFKVRSIVLSGTIEFINDKNSEANVRLNFQAFKKISMGSIEGYATVSGKNSMDLMFDVKRLVSIIEKVSVVSKSKTISTAVKLLNSYEGICAGFTLKRSSN